MTEPPALPPQLSALVKLQEAGWRLTPVITNGEVVRVDGILVMPDPFHPEADWVNVIAVNSETDAKGLRQNPDDETVWRREGDVIYVVEGFLELPRPGEPGAPNLVISRGEKLWTP